MRAIYKTGLMVLALQIVLFAAKPANEPQYVVPTKDDVPVYADRLHRGHETPLFLVGIQDHLTVISESRGRFKVRNGNGKIGWIEKKRVEKVGASKRFVFNNTDVHGYLDDPSPIYIIDADNPGNVALKLDRSFNDALRENTDKYTFERAAEHN